jgi:hypothetical protein
MADVGLDFETPKQSDVKRWEIAELLHQHGIKLAGSFGAGSADFKDLEAFLSARMTDSEGKRLLRKIQQRMRRARRST